MLTQMTPQALEEVVRGRRSVRAFTQEPVASGTIEEILELARWAPSSHNAQPWRFVALLSAESKERLALPMGEKWRRDLRSDGASPLAIDIRTTQSYKRITGAPAVLIACLSMEDMDRYPDAFRQSAERSLAVQSVGAFIQTLLLAAYSRGLGTVWMCAPAFCPDVVETALGLPKEWQPQAMVLLGYPAEAPGPPPRMEPADFIVFR